MRLSFRLAVAAALSCLALGGVAAQRSLQDHRPGVLDDYKPLSGQEGKDVVWVPTYEAHLNRMLDMARITKDDVVVDLGSGDGRTVIAAAKRGAMARGVEFNADLVAHSRRNAEAAGVARRASFVEGDIFATDFSDATVVTLFLLDNLNVRLRPTILKMKPGTRVVSNTFRMGDWVPDETAESRQECSSFCSAYLWIVPADVAGAWKLDGAELKLTQQYQMVRGTLVKDGKEEVLAPIRMHGREIEFIVDNKVWRGTVAGNEMTGAIEGGGSWKATRSGG